MSEIRKNGAPTMKTKGAIGDVYIDISTGAQYKCTGSYGIGGQSEYEWKKILDEKATKNEDNPTEIVSNLITDMTLNGANDDELERAINYSMHVIDAVKNGTDYKDSEIENNIPDLVERYQEEPKQENKNKNQNRNKSNNRSNNNRTDYANKFKG